MGIWNEIQWILLFPLSEMKIFAGNLSQFTEVGRIPIKSLRKLCQGLENCKLCRCKVIGPAPRKLDNVIHRTTVSSITPKFSALRYNLERTLVFPN